MPYRIEHGSGSKPWKLVKTDTGKVVGSSKTKADAEASRRLRMGIEHGWIPTGKKRRR